MTKLVYELLPELRRKHELTVPELARITVRMGIVEVPQKSIEALESPARAGQVPKAHTLVAIAAALGEPPEVFYEWPIAEAQARRGVTAGRQRAAAETLAQALEEAGRAVQRARASGQQGDLGKGRRRRRSAGGGE